MHIGAHPTVPQPTTPPQSQVSRGPGGEIVINAGAGDDKIAIARLAENIYGVRINGERHRFSRDEMRRLTVRGGAGKDQIRIAKNMDIPVRVEGNAGDDMIFNNANGAQISGGQGEDLILNRASGVLIQGGAQRDHIDSQGHFNTVRGGRGRDVLFSQGHHNHLAGGQGDDEINAVGNKNVLRGNAGADRMFAVGPENLAMGDAGWNHVGVLATLQPQLGGWQQPGAQARDLRSQPWGQNGFSNMRGVMQWAVELATALLFGGPR